MDSNEFKEEKGFEAHRSAPQHAQPQAEILAEHTVVGGETLSHIALKYYGSAVKDKWMVIYEANQDLIGDDPSRLARGLVLKIPKLPED
jgi:nucleoid-associated protein YgaU